MKCALIAALLLVGGACGTRFVDLTDPRDGGVESGQSATAMATCELVKRSDGAECRICYAPDGTLLNGSCVPMPPPAPSRIDPATATCKVGLMGDSRCLSCAASAGEYTTCLKCEAPIKTGAGGEICRTCLWSDAADRCLQCFAADGTTTHDDCDTFRKESFPKAVVPARN